MERQMVRNGLLSPLVSTIMSLAIYGGFAVVPIFILEYSVLDEFSERLNVLEKHETFDFIVVGAGVSGSVVANRLSKEYKVLLIEAGGEPNPLQSIPAAAPLFLNSPQVDYMYRTTPQDHACQSLNNFQSLWPRGRSLGGTSNLNFMVYARGHPLDYDNWAELTGDNRWSYENILPFFKMSENYASHEGNLFYHGSGGELNIEPSPFNDLARYFVKAAEESGYPNVDINAPYDEGFSQCFYTTKNRRRWGAFQAFLQPIREQRKKSLVIRKFSTVTKVLLNDNNEAFGVEYERFGVKRTAKAGREVILSAGTIGSAKILMISGIGPKEHLESLGIRTKVDLPVGKNLQDHVIGLVGPFFIDQPLTFLLDRDSGPSHLVNYAINGTGPLSSSGVAATGFIHSHLSKERLNATGLSWADIQLILLAIPIHQQGPEKLAELYNLNPQIAEEFYRPAAGKDSFHIMSIASRPKSRGEIRLASADPNQRPLINPNYLSNEYDVNIILEGIIKAIALVEETNVFKSVGGRLNPTPFPSCKHLEYRSLNYWECYLRHFTLSVYHQCGTCKMGRPEDPTAVVDSTLRVIGVNRLRVIDASIMPEIVSSNIQAACYAIGEMGAKFILESNK